MSIISACHTCGGNCLNCLYSDVCNYFCDVEPYNVAMIDNDAGTNNVYDDEVLDYVIVKEAEYEN